MSRSFAMIALHPQCWDMCRNGSKIWELRKVTHSPRCVDGLVVYATSPVSRIVGEVDLVSYHTGYVDDIWHVVKDGCGITREEYDLYYRGHETAIACRLGNVYEYIPSLDVLFPPQGYRYLYLGEYGGFLATTERRLVHAAR